MEIRALGARYCRRIFNFHVNTLSSFYVLYSSDRTLPPIFCYEDPTGIPVTKFDNISVFKSGDAIMMAKLFNPRIDTEVLRIYIDNPSTACMKIKYMSIYQQRSNPLMDISTARDANSEHRPNCRKKANFTRHKFAQCRIFGSGYCAKIRQSKLSRLQN
ncbi:hypothetical protein PsorP6_006111 [Peronosclerospora sorghi]|uniref:Uncharacterized protein n=1 Tax=Peronosclerospora sorghi TaxID=230839 RepID=A0ACC0W830_9STRA|nr:hypothetical protein PsorP6_006111 [Peronosclerospora sorghi]